jgi:hypothetical protein
LDYGGEDVLLVTLEFLDTPHYCRFVTLVFSFTSTMLENLDVGRILRHRNFNHNVVTNIRMLINSSDFDGILNSIIIWKLLNDWSDFEWQIDILGNSVGHYFEHTIWRNEGDGSVSVESCELDALMEFDIIDLYTFLLSLFGICSLSV